MFRKHLDEWVAEVGLTGHYSCGEYQLDVYPVFRTWACSMAGEYAEGYHPVGLAERNEERMEQKVSEMLTAIVTASTIENITPVSKE